MSALHIERYGHGPNTIVGFHGWGADHQKSFRRVIKRLPDEETTFWGIDLPGFGQSPKPADFTYANVTGQLTAAVDEILEDGQQATFIGACSGSYHVLEMARQRPERTKRLVVTEPLAFYPWFFKIFTRGGFGQLLYDLIFANPVGRRVTQTALEKLKVANAFDVMESFGKLDRTVPIQYLKFYRQLGTADQFSILEMPIVLLHGANTWGVATESVDIWMDVLPDVTPVRVDDVGHLVNQEAPEFVAELLLNGH